MVVNYFVIYFALTFIRFHSCGFRLELCGDGRRWLSVLALSSGKAGVAGATIPITSLCSGGETLDGEQSRF